MVGGEKNVVTSCSAIVSKQRGGLGILGKHERAAGAENWKDVGRRAMGERRIDEIAVLRREAVGMALRHDVGVPRRDTTASRPSARPMSRR